MREKFFVLYKIREADSPVLRHLSLVIFFGPLVTYGSHRYLATLEKPTYSFSISETLSESI